MCMQPYFAWDHLSTILHCCIFWNNTVSIIQGFNYDNKKVFYCYCKQIIDKFHRHLQRRHKIEDEVKDSCKRSKKEANYISLIDIKGKFDWFITEKVRPD